MNAEVLNKALLIAIVAVVIIQLTPLPDYIWCRKKKYKLLEERIKNLQE